MADANIDILTIDVKVETKDAKKDIKDLESTLEKVGSKTTGRKGAENPFDAMGKSAEETSKKIEDIGEKLDGLTTALGRVETAFNNAANARSNFTGGKSKKKETEDEVALEYKRLKAIEKRQKMESYVDKKTNPESTEGIYDQLKAEEKYQKMLDYIASKRSPKTADPVAEEYKALKEAEKRQKMLDYIASQKGESAAGSNTATSMLDSIVSKAEAAKGKIQELYTAMKPLAKIALFPITKPFKLATRAVTAFGRSIGKLLPALKRVAVYRAIRFALRAITDGFREGTQNAYQWSKALGGTFAASMDTLATSSLYLKNSLGALATPIINAVAPAIDWLIDKFVTLLNVANQVIALLTGASSWTKAIKYPKEYAEAANQAAGGAGKLAKAMTTILAIDELNPLNGDKGGGGGGGGGTGSALDYSQMFEEQSLAVSSTLASMFDPFKKAWDKKGAKVVKSIKNAISGVKSLVEAVGDSFWEVWTNGTGQKTVEHILGIFTGINDTIGNIARQLATGWKTDGLGTKIIQNLWNSLNDILGLWERITTSTANWAKGVDFTPLMGAIERVTKAIEPLVKIITDGLGWAWENILLPFGSWAIEEAIPATLDVIATAIDGISGVAEAAAPYLKAIWDDFLSPLAEFAGEAVVEVLGGINWLVEKLFELVQKAIPIVGKFATAFKQLISGDLEGAIATLKSLAPQQGSSTHKSASGMEFGGNSGTIGKVNLVANITDVVTKNLPADKKLIPTVGNIVKRQFKDPQNSYYETFRTVSMIGQIVKRTWKSDSYYEAFRTVLMIGQIGSKQYSNPTIQKSFEIANLVANIAGRTYGNDYIQKVLTNPDMTANITNVTGVPSKFYADLVISEVNTGAQAVLDIANIAKRLGRGNAMGGAFYNGKWHDIAQYATGGVPSHGSLFMAGEAGAEIVGHVGGRTEVLNQSQIASTIAAATQMSNASQNNILMQLLNGVEQLVEGQGDVRAYIPAGEVVSGLQRNNRRDGRALVPMGV